MKRLVVTLTLSVLLLGGAGCKKAALHSVLMPVDGDPTVSLRILFDVGSQNDPAGKEGLAALTARLLTQSSTQQHSYEEILELLYPVASSISDQVDKEMTVFTGRTHVDNLDEFYALFKEVLLEPGFNEDDFARVKNDRLNYVETSLRYSQDEELGKEALYEFVFEGTPYGHNEEGHVASLNSITLDDVKAFYETHYTQANLLVGLGGGFERDLVRRLKTDFEVLPAGTPSAAPAIKIDPIDGIEVKIIEKDAGSTAISFGFPIEPVRGHRDFYALKMARTWLGEHRNGFSRLYEVIRGKRGLNYGDYAYIEHFPRGYARRFPPPNVARRQQIFQIWIRPVPHEANVFAFRAAMRELQKVVDNGMSEEEFAMTRKFLKGYNLHYAPTTNTKLGYAMDDRFYGIRSGHWKTYAGMLDTLTREEVNAAIKKYWNYKNVKVVFITKDASGLKDALVSNAPSPITYGSEKPNEILEEDKEISTYPLRVTPDRVTIVKVDDLFSG